MGNSATILEEHFVNSDGSNIVQFPKKLKSELIADFVEANRKFIQNFDSTEDLNTEYSVSTIEDMVKYETQDYRENDFSYRKLLRFIRSQDLSNNELSYIGDVLFEGYNCIWKIIFFDNIHSEIPVEQAMIIESVNRKIALLLPEKLSQNS